MKNLIYVAVFLLMGCTTVPVRQTFPILPDELQKPCPALLKIEGDSVTLSEFTKIVVTNYGTMHECAAQVEAFNDWYRSQAEIFNKANK